jgi:ABC-type multidrug transport system ATPase subunit
LNTVLSIEGLTKHYGRIRAVNDLWLEVGQGSVYGLLGPNGSGKTTTLGILLDVIRPNTGRYRWFGKAPGAEIRQKIGALLETPAFYPYLSAEQNLRITARIKNCGTSRLEEVLKAVNLYVRRRDAYRTFSLGMKQRLAIAATLLADPPVLIFDEPANGLDPQGIAEIRQLILRIAGEGKTILLASHILDEVQKVCSHFAVLNKGKLVFAGRVEEVLSGHHRLEMAANDPDALHGALADYPGLSGLERTPQGCTVQLNGQADPADLNRYLFEKGICLSQLAPQRNSLETEFLRILSESDDATR